MILPGMKDLGDFTVTTAGTANGTPQTGLEGIIALSWNLRLAWGGGGTSIKAYLQTSLDQGTTWIDIACIAMLAASLHRVVNLSGLTPKTTLITPTDGALADDSCVDGILGDRFRTKLVSVGTYASSTVVSSRIVAR